MSRLVPLHTVSLGMIEPIRPRARHGQMRSVDGREEVLETKKAKLKKARKKEIHPHFTHQPRVKKQYHAFNKTGTVNEAFFLCASCIIFERGFIIVFISLGRKVFCCFSCYCWC